MKHLIRTDGRLVREGETVTSFRGEEAIVTGWLEPNRQDTTGRIYVKDRFGRDCGFFPSVFDLHWID